MRNSPLLPTVSLLLAIVLGVAAFAPVGAGQPIPLSELQLGALAGVLAFGVFGIQGLISVGLEGQELRPGVRSPVLTNPLSAAIVAVSLLLFIDAVLLGYGIVSGWSTARLGVAAGVGCLFLAALFIFYNEAFLGDEACFDDRDDGVPW